MDSDILPFWFLQVELTELEIKHSKVGLLGEEKASGVIIVRTAWIKM